MQNTTMNETALSYIDFMSELNSMIDLLQAKCQKKWFVNTGTRDALNTLIKQRKKLAAIVAPMDQFKRDFLQMNGMLKHDLADIELWKLNDVTMELQELSTVSLSPASMTLFINRPLIKRLNLKFNNFKSKVQQFHQEELLNRIAY